MEPRRVQQTHADGNGDRENNRRAEDQLLPESDRLSSLIPHNRLDSVFEIRSGHASQAHHGRSTITCVLTSTNVIVQDGSAGTPSGSFEPGSGSQSITAKRPPTLRAVNKLMLISIAFVNRHWSVRSDQRRVSGDDRNCRTITSADD